MLSVLEKKFKLREALKTELDFYSNMLEENPKIELIGETKKFMSHELKLYEELSAWFLKLTMEIQDPKMLKVFHLRYNRGIDLYNIADELMISKIDVEIILMNIESQLMDSILGKEEQ